jgi:hypothetical protein
VFLALKSFLTVGLQNGELRTGGTLFSLTVTVFGSNLKEKHGLLCG